MSDDRKLEVTIVLKGANKIREDLRGLGKDGQEALRSLERHAEPASKAMGEIEDASGRATAGLEGFVGRAGGIATAIASLSGGGLTAGVAMDTLVKGVQAVVAKTKEAVDTFDQIGKSAEKVGITTDAFQELQYAAMQSGVGAEGIGKALEQLNRRAGETAAGTGDAKDTFKRLNVSVLDDDGSIKATDTLLTELAEKFENIRSPAERAAAAGKLFGEELGTKMAAMLANGTAGMEKLRQEARDLGVVVDEHALKSATDAADKLDAMSKAMDTNPKTAVISLAPELAAKTKLLTDAEHVVSELLDGFRTVKNMSNDGLNNRLVQINKEISEINQNRGGSLETNGNLKKNINRAAFGTNDENIHNERLIRLGKQRDTIQKEIETRKENHTSPSAAPPVPPPAGAKDEKLAPLPGKKPAPPPTGETDKLQEYIDQMRFKVTLLGMDEGTRARAEARKKASDIAISQNTVLTPEQEAEINAMVDAMTSYEKATQKAAEAQRELQQLGRQAGSTLTKGLSDIVFEAKDLQSTLSGVLNQLARLTLNAATAPLERQVSTWFGDLFSLAAPTVPRPAISPQKQESSWFGSLLGGIGGLFGFSGLFGSGDTNLKTKGFHSGGIAGGRQTFERSMPAILWDGAPRYHIGGIAGLMPGEVPAILKRGEGVFTPEQMAALGQTAGGQAPVNNVVNVTVNRSGAGGNVAEDKAMAAEVARQVQVSLRGLVAQELITQSRPGGLLSRTIG